MAPGSAGRGHGDHGRSTLDAESTNLTRRTAGAAAARMVVTGEVDEGTSPMAAFFFSLLALTALIGAVQLAILLLAARRDPDGQAASLLDDLAPAALPLAAVVAATSMGGSLYFSEVLGYVPCTLCWYQRIAMYPLAPMLGIAAVRRDPSVRVTGWVLAGSGAVISVYHYVIQWLPNLEATSCSADNPCSAVWVREFGFVSIPFMALCGFLAIAALLAVAARRPVDDDEDADDLMDHGPLER
jgi:disulfide bond formation protein DsbB